MTYFLFSILLVLSAVTQARDIPLAHFVKHGDYLNVQLSPDGKHIAARVRANDRVYLVFLNVETMEAVGGVKPEKDDVIHSVTWINNHRLVYELAEKQHYYDSPVPTGELYATNIDNGKRTIIYGYRAGNAKTGTRISWREDTKATQEVISLLENDEDHILIIEHLWSARGNTYYDDRKKQPHITKLNIYSGRTDRLEVLPHPGSRPLATKDGHVNFISWKDEQGNEHSAYRKNKDQPWQDLATVFGADANLTPKGLSKDGTHVYLSGRTGDNGVYTMFSLNLQTGKYQKAFPEHKTDIEDYIKDDQTGMPVVGITFPNRSNYVYTDNDSDTALVHKRLAKSFAGKTVNITSRSRDGNTLLVHVSSDVNPGEYYIFDKESMNARFIWANRSWIYPDDMAPKQPFQFTTEDGLELNGYLTLPKFRDDNTKPPMVVMIHGGPHQPGTRDFWHFDSEVQLLANRGYAVLQVNFRGSDGYGLEFIRMGHRQWGGKMIDDINAAARWVINNEYVDGSRVCVYGASYGGYAALMSAVKAPELYQCTVGYVGIYDLNDMFNESDIPDGWGGLAYLKKVVGEDTEKLQQYSPINHVDKIKAKVMLIHGAQDKRTPEVSAQKLKDRLEQVGNAPVYLRFRQSGHGVYDEASRAELYQGLLAFLGEHIG